VGRQNQQVSDRLEDYLEAILALEKANKVARVKDIAEKIGVLRGSVTGALKNLAEKGLIHYEPYSFITLTPEGKKIAAEVRRRHEVLRDFLQNVLLMEAGQAEENACRMEHAVDRNVIDRLVMFLDYIHQCPRTGKDWVNLFVNYHADCRPDLQTCLSCVRSCLDRAEARMARQKN
jgi:DtxR family Mn-dependent transcriptional regulator